MRRALLAALAASTPALVAESVQASTVSASTFKASTVRTSMVRANTMPANSLPMQERYAVSSEAFASFVRDSYKELGHGPQGFEVWLQTAYAQHPKAWLGRTANLRAALEGRKAELAMQRDPILRARLERKTGIWLHRLVKALIPKFSLDRGFEFVNTVNIGERQCLLQSVLIAALAQEMGVRAGAAMVWRNQNAQVSNLGHVVTVFKLSDGKDVLVDASDPEPFMRHQGLLMTDSGVHQLRFLEPVYDNEANITAYRRKADGFSLRPAVVHGLEREYLRSQFYYYRGERAANGFIGPSTPAGLNASAKFLETAVRLDPSNPLAVYVLGLVYRRQGREAEARARLQKGLALYERYGFVPDGPKAAIAP